MSVPSAPTQPSVSPTPPINLRTTNQITLAVRAPSMPSPPLGGFNAAGFHTSWSVWGAGCRVNL